MMKKIFLLSLMLYLTVVSAWADYSYTDENGVTWGFTVEGAEATLTTVSGEGEDVIIPEMVYDGETAYMVVATKDGRGIYIRDFEGLFYKKAIKTVTLPSTLKSLGIGTFCKCSNLTSVVNLSASTSIGGYAFSGCSNLTSVGDQSARTSIGDYAFYNCGLTSIDLSACTSIGEAAFSGCSSLTSVGDLSACTSIGISAFENCRSLTSVGDLRSCTQIGLGAFSGCKQLRVVNLSAPVVVELIFHSNILYGETVRPFSDVAVAVPADLVAAYKAADYWKNMQYEILVYGEPIDYDITVEAQDKTSAIYSQIGEELLDNVFTLKLSGTINGYDIMVMRNKMHNLHHLDLSDARIVANDYQYYTGCHTEDNVLGANSFRDLANLISIKLPTTITSIGADAFSRCTSLHSIDIPEGVTTISENAFPYCSSLSTISFPSTLQTIGDWAFLSCTSLTSVTLPENLNSIGYCAFQFCTALTEVRIPSMVTSIVDNAFAGCDNLKDVWTYTLVPQAIGQNTFSNYSTATLHIQKTSHDPYYWDTQWSQFSLLTEFEGTYSQWLINNQTDYVIDDHTGVIDTEEGATGEIMPGSGLISENENDDQQMDEIIIDDNGSEAGSVIGNGHLWCNWLQFLIDVVQSKWHFFSFPYRVKLSDITCEGSWLFRYYDGAARAENGGGGWKNLPAGTEYLEPGVGYIFQSNKGGKLKIRVSKDNLDMNPADQHNAMTAHSAENAQDASWNFMGNPFTSYFDIDHTGYEAPITIWNGSSYEAVRPGDDNYHLRPFQAFFVQKPEGCDDIVFPKDNRETYNQSQKSAQDKARRKARRGVDAERLIVNLTLSDGTTTDKTRVVFNDKKQNAYELDCDASKFMTSGVAQLYTMDARRVQYAINERPNGDVPVGYVAPTAGTYAIEAVRMDKPMLLKDLELGITFDLANGAYEFESAAGTFGSRFMLVANDTATGIADIRTKTGVSIMPTAGGLCVDGLGGSAMSIYSLDGKLVGEPTSDGIVSLQRGTYVVSVGSTTAKVMVK